jgi:hypothetical protein
MTKKVLTRGEFYSNYDLNMPKYCEPYFEFLNIGARALPKDVSSICDLGIGTGNFSLAAKVHIPNLNICGVDYDQTMISAALNKIPDALIYNRDLFAEPLPKADYMISSLALHHLDTASRNQKLADIVKEARGLINFDLVLFGGYSFDDCIRDVLAFASKSFPDPESIKNIECEMRKNDNPMPIEEQKMLFESLGLKFEILAEKRPYVVYHAYWPIRNV